MKHFIWALVAWILTNIPLALVLFKYKVSTAIQTITLAPNQFLFLFVFFPASVYLVSRAAAVLTKLIVERARLYVIIGSWSFAIVVAIPYTIFDYLSPEAPDFYQLTPSAADDAVAAVQDVLKELDRTAIPGDPNSLWTNSARLVEAGKSALENTDPINQGRLNRVAGQIPVKEASRYLLVVSTAGMQESYGLTDAWLRKSNALELFVAMVGLMHLIYWIGVTFVGRLRFGWKRGARISASYLAVAVAFLMVFALGSDFNVQVRQLLYGEVKGVVHAGAFAAVGFVFLASLLTVVFLKDRWLDALKVVYPLIFGIAAYVFVSEWFEIAVEIFGRADNPAILFMAILICVLFVASAVFLVVGGQLAANAIPANQADRENSGSRGQTR